MDNKKEILLMFARFVEHGDICDCADDEKNIALVERFLYELASTRPFLDNPYKDGEPLPILPIVATDTIKIEVKK